MDLIEDRNLFKTSIGIALEEWDSLQAAIDHNMGGENAGEKVNWMIDVIRQYFIDTRNSFDFDDAVNYVGEIVNNEFDTLVEDGTIEILIRKIMRFFSLSTEGQYDELRSLLDEKQSRLNETAEARNRRRQEIRLNEDLNELDMESGEDDSENDDDGDDQPNRMADNRARADEDGWIKF